MKRSNLLGIALLLFMSVYLIAIWTQSSHAVKLVDFIRGLDEIQISRGSDLDVALDRIEGTAKAISFNIKIVGACSFANLLIFAIGLVKSAGKRKMQV